MPRLRPEITMRLAFGAVIVAAAALVIRAAVQQTPQPTFRTGADYVRVDVYPTSGGVPVDDLTRGEFQILEDGVPQQIDAFEHVSVRAGRTSAAAPDPSTIARQTAALENARARVFVLYLDIYHVSSTGSANVTRPLVQALDRMIGADDLVAVMTPDMTARDLSFSHRAETIERLLAANRFWGQRGQLLRPGGQDETEVRYQLCYPGTRTSSDPCTGDDRGVADEMIARRREQLTLDSVSDLIQVLGDAREERKALLLVSEGWLLYRPNRALARQIGCDVPIAPIGTDPRTGGPRGVVDDPNRRTLTASCEGDRQRLADIDHQVDFVRLVQQANRANVTFYPIDPRGLPVFDTQLDQQRTGLPAPGQPTIPPPSQDAANLRNRLGTLRTLAADTDGISVLDSNDLAAGLRRIEADLSSYYLLAYHSSGKLDNKFHRITVRVTRPGVQVRARSGFLAAPAPTVQPRPPLNTGQPETATAASAAVSILANVARDAPLRLRPAVERRADGTLALWVDGELQPSAWPRGGSVSLTLLYADGQTTTPPPEDVVSGIRSFRRRVDLKPDTDRVTIRVRAVGAGGDPTLTDVVDVSVPEAARTALVSRRGPSTANREMVTTDLRFRRSEQIRVDVPGTQTTFTARLLDRSGGVLSVPATVAQRIDDAGVRWTSASVTLAPLAPADYVIELVPAAGGQNATGAHIVVPFRIVP